MGRSKAKKGLETNSLFCSIGSKGIGLCLRAIDVLGRAAAVEYNIEQKSRKNCWFTIKRKDLFYPYYLAEGGCRLIKLL